MAHRYFTEKIADGKAQITGQDALHLAKVLRAKPGQTVLLCNGAGTDHDAVITAVSLEEVCFDITASRRSAAEPTLWAEVFIGMAKGERMDYAVQKAVELGASAIWPFYSAHSVVKPKKDEAKVERYARIAKEAAKQCGRGLLPTVHLPLGFDEMLKKATIGEKSLFFYEGGGTRLRESVEGNEKTLAIITGAEGGFSPQEAQAAQRAGCVMVGLGPRILRCETAPVAALAAVMCLTGNFEDC